jgi:glycosyltransferase involved in cell wall biosynthesis
MREIMLGLGRIRRWMNPPPPPPPPPPTDYEDDPYPGEPRILFVGPGESTHARSWIDLLEGRRLNIRIFNLPTFRPPHEWPVRTYISNPDIGRIFSESRISIPFDPPPPEPPKPRFPWQSPKPAPPAPPPAHPIAERWLDAILRRWNPEIVHTFGLDGSSYFYLSVRRWSTAAHRPCWIAQLRGATDLVMHRLLPEHAPLIDESIRNCDQIVADNQLNYDTCRELGVPDGRLSSLGIMPGTGGLDLEEFAKTRSGPPSTRPRLILWPKAYESPYSKAVPVLEALRLAWDRIRPCKITALAVVQSEVRMWMQTLPPDLRDSIEMRDRIPREDVLSLMGQARVMLAPSLSDGIPNCLYEAMAGGALPIVSPLKTITPLVQEPRNVVFARNLYPQELAEALVRAMNDDPLADAAAAANLELVSRVANRVDIARRLEAYYRDLTSRRWERKAS